MIKSINLILLFVVLALSIVACSEEPDTSKSVLKSNIYFEAAAKKVMLENPGLPRWKANCVIEEMIASNVGLGEVSKMKLNILDRDQNTEILNKAYMSAIKDCSQRKPVALR